MKKFDISVFEKNKIEGEYRFTLSDGSEVRQIDAIASDRRYQEEIKRTGSPITNIAVYFADSGNMNVTGQMYYECEVGIWRFYDEKGDMIEEKNWDASYVFTIEDLEKKMLEMGVTLLRNILGASVVRNDIEKPLYIVSYPTNVGTPSSLNVFTVDGASGEILSKTTTALSNMN